MNNELDKKRIQPFVVRFDVYPVLVLRPTCVPEKVGVTLKRRKSKRIFPLKRFKYVKNQRKGVKQKMRARRFRSSVNCQRALKQKGVKAKPWCTSTFGDFAWRESKEQCRNLSLSFQK